MPRMHVGGRAVDLSSDDLLCPAGTSLAFRAAWVAACCVFVAFARPLLACSAPLWALVVANIAWGAPLLALDTYLAVATTRGTLLADAPRKTVARACAARSVAAPVDAALCIAALVTAAVAGAAGSCDPLQASPIGDDGLSPPPAPLWVAVLVFACVGAAVFGAFACCAATLWAVAPSAALYRRLARVTATPATSTAADAVVVDASVLRRGDRTEDDEALATAARRWSRCCWLCSRACAVGTLSHPGITTTTAAADGATPAPAAAHAYLRPPFDAIGAIMAGVFEGAERLGLTASDLCAGLALVRAVQKDEERGVLVALARERAAQAALLATATSAVDNGAGGSDAPVGPSLQPPPLPPLPGLSPESGAPVRRPPAARRRFSSSLLRPFTLLTAGSSAASADAAAAPAVADAGSRRRLPQLPSVSSVMTSARTLVRQHRATLVAHRLYAQHLTGTAPLDTRAPADRAALDEAAHFAPYATAAYGFLIAAYMSPLTCACVLPAAAVAYTAGDACADIATSRSAWRRLWGDAAARPHYTHCHGLGRRGPLARLWRLAAGCGRRLACRRDARAAAVERAAAAAAADVDEERGGGLASGDLCGCNESALRWILQRHLRRDAAPDSSVEQVLAAAAAPARGNDGGAASPVGGVLLLAAGSVSLASSDGSGVGTGGNGGGVVTAGAPAQSAATGADKDAGPSLPPPPVTPGVAAAASAPLLPSLGAGTTVTAQPFSAPATPAPAPAPIGAASRSLRHAILHTSHTNAPLSTPWYVAVDARRRALVVAIRGTLSMDDALTDALAWPLGGRRTADVADTARLLAAAGVTPPPDPRRCYVHGGMWEAAKRVRDALLRHGLLETVDPGPGALPFPPSVAAAAAAGGRTAACCTRPDHCGPACAFAASAAAAAAGGGGARADLSVAAEALPTSSDGGGGGATLSSSPPQHHHRLRLVIVGHSLGAGVGALLSLLLRPHFTSLRCYAISPPGALVSRHLGAAMDGWTVSVVVGKDLVPRMSLPSLHGLLDEATDYLGRAPRVSKPGLVAALCGACCASACVPSACYPLCAPVAHDTAAAAGADGGCCCRSCGASAGAPVLSPTTATAVASPPAGVPGVSPLAASGGGRSPFRLRARSLLLPPGAPLPPEADTAFARALRAAAAARAPLRAALQRDAAGGDVEEGGGGGSGGAGAAPAASAVGALGGTLTPAAAAPPAAPAAAPVIGASVADGSGRDWTMATRPRAASAGSTASSGSVWSDDDDSDVDADEQQQRHHQRHALGRHQQQPYTATVDAADGEAVAVEVGAPPPPPLQVPLPPAAGAEPPLDDASATAQRVADAVAPPPSTSGGPSLLAARVRAPPPLLTGPSPATTAAAPPPLPATPLPPFTPPASLAAQRSLLSRPMYLPGRILSLVKVNVAAVDVPTAACRRALPAHPAAADRLAAVFCCCFRRVRRVYEPRWGRRGGFRRIQVSSDMVADHMPDHAHESLRAAADDALLLGGPAAGVRLE
jgi:hypothetical protein